MTFIMKALALPFHVTPSRDSNQARAKPEPSEIYVYAARAKPEPHALSLRLSAGTVTGHHDLKTRSVFFARFMRLTRQFLNCERGAERSGA